MVEKKIGNTDQCKTCGEPLKCGWSKASDKFAPKEQWQNGDGSAHYTKFDGQRYVCPGSVKSNTPSEKVTSQPTNQKIVANIPNISPTNLLTEAVRVVEGALSLADQRVRVIYPTLDVNTRDFGQIRSKFAEELVATHNALIIEEALRNLDKNK